MGLVWDAAMHSHRLCLFGIGGGFEGPGSTRNDQCLDVSHGSSYHHERMSLMICQCLAVL